MNNAILNGATVGVGVFNGLDVVDGTGTVNIIDGWLWDTYTTTVTLSGTGIETAGINTVDCLIWVAQVLQVNIKNVAP